MTPDMREMLYEVRCELTSLELVAAKLSTTIARLRQTVETLQAQSEDYEPPVPENLEPVAGPAIVRSQG